MGKKQGSKPKKKFEIETYRDWCKRCHVCVAFCPREAIKVNKEGYPFLEDPERCEGCGMCEMRCPDFAINLKAILETEDPTEKETAEENEQENK